MGVSGMLLILFAVLVFQLADRDNRNGWIWAGSLVAAAMLMSQVSWLGGFGTYLAFVGTLIALVWTKPLKRKW
jgi:hypothetical protein